MKFDPYRIIVPLMNAVSAAWQTFLHLFDARVWLMVGIAVLAIYQVDPHVLVPFVVPLAGMVLIMAMILAVRKIMVPQIDMQELAIIAKHDPLAAAIVVLALCLLMASLVIGTVWWLRGGIPA